MVRPLNLGRIKEAWQLRREGKQQKEIADALNLSLRHIQNYLSLDWLTQRSMRVLVKGGVGEVNSQLNAMRGLNGRVAEASTEQVTSRAPAAVAEALEGAGGDGPLVCFAFGKWADVARLEVWGVPKDAAPGLLGAWRKAHRDGDHELCSLWGEIAENIQADIPFADAYDLAIAGWLAEGWGAGSLKAVTKLYRLYRPWEGKVHRKVYLDELRSIIREGGGSEEPGAPFGGLPRRFLFGLPRKSAHVSRESEDDDDD